METLTVRLVSFLVKTSKKNRKISKKIYYIEKISNVGYNIIKMI